MTHAVYNNAQTLAPPMKKVLFVCLGNICRSPAAEGCFRHLAEATATSQYRQFDSAGIARYHIGKVPDQRMRNAAIQRGIDLSTLRARQICRDDYYNYDIIFAMDRSNLDDLNRAAPADKTAKGLLLLDVNQLGSEDFAVNAEDALSDASRVGLDVPDPYYGEQKDFERVLDIVASACKVWHGELMPFAKFHHTQDVLSR